MSLLSVKAAICFAQFGPYHHARVRALQDRAEFKVVPLQLSSSTSTYAWQAHTVPCNNLQTLCNSSYETLNPLVVFFRAFKFFKREQIICAFLPSYAPAAETALLLAAKSAGVHCIMMNESHAGTEQATGWKKHIKRKLVALFDAGLVGGSPQRRHFVSLGMEESVIFPGYDAIDNDYFTEASARAKNENKETRRKFELPQRYFLSLGRMVEKKNLARLVEAYSRFVEQLNGTDREFPALVFVGSGPEEPTLRELCKQHDIEVVDHTADTSANRHSTLDRLVPRHPKIHFYGFRQIEENPSFYALADAFILPSLWEEWGLVVNEAMACGLPVLVSEKVGSAEDLVKKGENGYTFDPTKSEELAECLASVYQDDALRSKMAEKSKEIIADWGCDNFARNAIAAVECAMR